MVVQIHHVIRVQQVPIPLLFPQGFRKQEQLDVRNRLDELWSVVLVWLETAIWYYNQSKFACNLATQFVVCLCRNIAFPCGTRSLQVKL